METPWGISAAEFFQFENGDEPNQEFIVVGFENGSIHVYDYTKHKKESYKKLIFNVKQFGSEADDSAFDRFCDSHFTQTGPITSIK